MSKVDYNIVQNGELASPLNQLLQEIETIIVSDGKMITMSNDDVLNLDQYLFKNGLDASAIASRIQSVLDRNIIDNRGFLISVSCRLLNGQQRRDTLFIDVEVYAGTTLKERLTYKLNP